MPRADLTIGLRADRLTPYLRADQLRYDTLTTLAAAMAEDPDLRRDLIDRLDELGAVVSGRAREGETDALVGDVEDLAGMGRAEMDLVWADLRQLATESADAVDRLKPTPVRDLPRTERGAA
jgi:hypothetical protein